MRGDPCAGARANGRSDTLERHWIRVNHASRRGALAAIERRSAGEWLFARVDMLFAAAADRLGVEAAPMREALQLLRYDENCHFQQWHSDAGLDAIDRRFLSASIELSAPDEYAGGDLEIVPFLMGPRRRGLGSAQVFHSRLLHRVTPVTSGTRWALVAWTGAVAG